MRRFNLPAREQFHCRSCGLLMEKHVIKEGARYHVLRYWGGGLLGEAGTECNEPLCEINHECEERK